MCEFSNHSVSELIIQGRAEECFEASALGYGFVSMKFYLFLLLQF